MKNKLILSIIVLLIWGVQVHPVDVPVELQVKLMLKILSVDRNFNRFGNPITIGVSSDNIMKELAATRNKLKVKGKNFQVEKMNSPEDVSKYKVVYIGKNWNGSYNLVSGMAGANGCLVFCETEAGVRSGCAISFKEVGGKPKILVNLENARKQGSDFPAGFLRITELVN